MRKAYQPGGWQEAIKGKDTCTIVAFAFTVDGLPTLLEVEEYNLKQRFYDNSLYSLVQTRKTPRQWFLDGPYAAQWPQERKFHNLERKVIVDFSFYTKEASIPLRSLWVAPHLHIAASNPENLTGVDLLAELPSMYALDGHLQCILEHAYEDFFIWCEQCEDWESDSSRVHNRHVEMAIEAHEERAFFCERCRLYRKLCPHFASNEAFWATVKSIR